MTNADNAKARSLSRRRVLGAAALIAGGGALAGSSLVAAAAPAPLSQKAANYQTMPKGNARCNVCSQWQAPSSCKVVVGTILPTGWCSLYAPKA